MKIMVCYDGSDKSHKALEKTIELFKTEGADIIVVTVVEEPLDATSVDDESFEKWRGKREEDLEEAALWVADHGLEVDALLLIGDPRKMIIEAAQKKEPDMIVVARRGRGRIKKMVLGSVCAYIIRHAGFPVIVC